MTVAEARYVALTTYRRDGRPVVTPVWIAPLPDGRAGIITDLAAGKTKRVRNNPSVLVQPCSARGAPRPGTAPVAAEAAVVTGPEATVVAEAIRGKYRVAARLLDAWEWLRRRTGRGERDDTALVLTFAG